MNKKRKIEALDLKPPCRSRHVVAVLITTAGEVFVGSNGVENPQPSCPRKLQSKKRGEGWNLCKKICKQTNHAEADALARAGAAAQGSRIYILGHDCACDSCHEAMLKAGVSWYLPVPESGPQRESGISKVCLH